MATPKELERRFFAVMDAQRWGELGTLTAPNATAQVGSAPPTPFDPAFYCLSGRASRPRRALGRRGRDRVIPRGRFEGTHEGPFHGRCALP